MSKLFNLFKYGFITIFTSPLWLLFFIYSFIKCIILFFVFLFKAIILFFSGKSIFESKEDRAIKIMKQKESEELAIRRMEALKDADQ